MAVLLTGSYPIRVGLPYSNDMIPVVPFSPNRNHPPLALLRNEEVLGGGEPPKPLALPQYCPLHAFVGRSPRTAPRTAAGPPGPAWLTRHAAALFRPPPALETDPWFRLTPR